MIRVLLCYSFETKNKTGGGKKLWTKAVQKITIQQQQETALACIGEDRLQKLTCPTVCVTAHDGEVKVGNTIINLLICHLVLSSRFV